MDTLEQLHNAAFNSYDPDGYDEDSYDPDNATGKGGNISGTRLKRSPVQNAGGAIPQAQFDIQIANTHTSDITIELFNAQSSDAKFNAFASPFGFGVSYSPLFGATDNFTDPITGTTFVGSATSFIPARKFVSYDLQGNKVYQVVNATATGQAGVTISCSQMPYRALVEYSGQYAMRIDRMRMSYTTSAQINQDLRTSLRTFLGKTGGNNISPRTFLRPDQFQSLIVDVTTPIDINNERGISYTIRPAETVLITMFCSVYTKSSLGNRI